MELTLFAPQGPPGWDANHQLDAPAWEELWFLPREVTEQPAHSSKVSSQARQPLLAWKTGHPHHPQR